MALVSMFLCNQSYASHGRDFLLWVTILNSSVARKLQRVVIAQGEVSYHLSFFNDQNFFAEVGC